MFSKTLSFLLRIPLYLFFFWLSFFFLFPRIEPEILAMVLLMPLASLAIFLDIYLTSKIQKRKVEDVIAKRILIVDNILAGEDGINPNRRIEPRDVEALPEEKPLLESNQHKHEQ